MYASFNTGQYQYKYICQEIIHFIDIDLFFFKKCFFSTGEYQEKLKNERNNNLSREIINIINIHLF